MSCCPRLSLRSFPLSRPPLRNLSIMSVSAVIFQDQSHVKLKTGSKWNRKKKGFYPSELWLTPNRFTLDECWARTGGAPLPEARRPCSRLSCPGWEPLSGPCCLPSGELNAGKAWQPWPIHLLSHPGLSTYEGVGPTDRQTDRGIVFLDCDQNKTIIYKNFKGKVDFRTSRVSKAVSPQRVAIEISHIISSSGLSGQGRAEHEWPSGNDGQTERKPHLSVCNDLERRGTIGALLMKLSACWVHSFIVSRQPPPPPSSSYELTTHWRSRPITWHQQW